MSAAGTSHSADRVPKVVRQFVTLLMGMGGGSVLNFVAFALIARRLGPGAFGVLTLVRSYAAVVTSLASFQSSLAIIKFGAEARTAGELQHVAGLVKWGVVLDTCAGLVGILVGAALCWSVGPLVGVPADARVAVTLYLIVVIFSVQGTPNAVLRLFESYRRAAAIYVGSAALSLVAVALVTFSPSGRSIAWYLGVYVATEFVACVMLFVAALRTLRAHGVRGYWPRPLGALRARWPGIGRFVIVTNLQGTVKQFTNEADVFVIGSVLGTEATGLYKVAKQLGAISSKLLEPMYQVIYVELARCVAERRYDRVARSIVRLGMFAGGVAFCAWLAIFFFADDILLLAVGPGFASAASVAVWYFAGLVITHGSFGLSRALLALGRPGLWLWLSVPTSLFYLAALLLFTHTHQTVGAGIAYFVYQLIFSCAMAVPVVVILRRLQRDRATGRG